MDGICRTPECNEKAKVHPPFDNKWCSIRHLGTFPHKCEQEGCASTVEFDDEPFCFTHSPDEGSSVPGYSAWERAQASDHSKVLG